MDELRNDERITRNLVGLSVMNNITQLLATSLFVVRVEPEVNI